MENKYKVSDFATILGVVPKTIYKMIGREELITVNEKVNNRLTTLIVASDEQIEELKKIYGKNTVNVGNYYNSVTENESSLNYNDNSVEEIYGNNTVKYNNNNVFTNEVIDKILTLNDGYNEQLREYSERIEKLNEQLISAKSTQLLLEDKASREGMYLKNINDLEKEKEQLKLENEKEVKRLNFIISCLKYSLITLFTIILIAITIYLTVNYLNNTETNSNSTVKVEVNQQ